MIIKTRMLSLRCSTLGRGRSEPVRNPVGTRIAFAALPWQLHHAALFQCLFLQPMLTSALEILVSMVVSASNSWLASNALVLMASVELYARMQLHETLVDAA